MMAAANGHPELVELLLRLGADLEARDHGGDTALALAAKFKQRPMVALLMQHGAALERGNDYYGMRWANLSQGS